MEPEMKLKDMDPEGLVVVVGRCVVLLVPVLSTLCFLRVPMAT